MISSSEMNTVAPTAISGRPSPHDMPMPIMTNMIAASRGSPMPERNRMNAPRPTRPNARAMLSPMTTTISAPAAAISVWVWAPCSDGGDVNGMKRRQNR